MCASLPKPRKMTVNNCQVVDATPQIPFSRFVWLTHATPHPSVAKTLLICASISLARPTHSAVARRALGAVCIECRRADTSRHPASSIRITPPIAPASRLALSVNYLSRRSRSTQSARSSVQSRRRYSRRPNVGVPAKSGLK